MRSSRLDYRSRLIATMQLTPLLLGTLPLFSSLVSATALTYKIAANEKACFFTDVERQNAKVAFYFAVSPCRYSHDIGDLSAILALAGQFTS